ncbi:MAG TPA: cell division protein SepF [Clostridiaceae bacterium]|jgi:cell division inhibitor SepF|nr:cell division protein SepF [Clostridiaceae bacterium]
MAGFFEKLFGRSNDDYEEYNEFDDYYNEVDSDYDDPGYPQDNYSYNEPIEKTKPQSQSDHRRSPGRVVDLNQKSYQQQIVIIEPSNIESAQQVCDDVRSGKTVICNIEKIDPKIAQRVIDFITGAAYALRGNVMPISALIFVVAPGTTNITHNNSLRETSDTVEEYVRRAAVQAR